MKPLAIAVVSGGMDSITLTYDLLSQGYDVKMLSFDYGQRHRKELDSAAFFANHLGLIHRVVDLRSLANILGGSSLTDEAIAVPDGHYTAESMKITVVPNRNAIMLAIAYGWAVSTKAECVFTAVHSGDHAIYPDCRPGFIGSLEEAFLMGNEGFSRAELVAPFISMTKAEIVKLGSQLGIPYEHTWSCYSGTEIHCGRCGTCIERKEAFHLAHVVDFTSYKDETFWKEEVERVRNA